MPTQAPNILSFFKYCHIDPEIISKNDIIDCEMDVLVRLGLMINTANPGDVMRLVLGYIRLDTHLYYQIEELS
jgi:hypothetical protein